MLSEKRGTVSEKGSSLVEPFRGLTQRRHGVKSGLYTSPELAAFGYRLKM